MDYSDTILVVMLKDSKTGFLVKEIASYHIYGNVELITSIFAEKEEHEIFIYIKLSTGKEVRDWEFSAVFDYYDTQIYNDEFIVYEEEDCYNPTWTIKFKYESNTAVIKEKIENLLNIHANELIEVYNVIKDKESDYI